MPILNENDARVALERANSKSLETYRKIMGGVYPTDEGFQALFSRFYRISGTGRNDSWRTAFYNVFSQSTEESSYEQILCDIAAATGRCEGSFASKMLATLDSSKPILDTNVLKFLDLGQRYRRYYRSLERRIEKALGVYAAISQWYAAYMQSQDAETCIALFDAAFPDYQDISMVKKIDFLLYWHGTRPRQGRNNGVRR